VKLDAYTADLPQALHEDFIVLTPQSVIGNDKQEINAADNIHLEHTFKEYEEGLVAEVDKEYLEGKVKSKLEGIPFKVVKPVNDSPKKPTTRKGGLTNQRTPSKNRDKSKLSDTSKSELELTKILVLTPIQFDTKQTEDVEMQETIEETYGEGFEAVDLQSEGEENTSLSLQEKIKPFKEKETVLELIKPQVYQLSG